MTLQLNPIIMLDGNAQEAISFYEVALNAKVLFKQTVGEGPQNPDAPLSAEEMGRVAHSVLKVGDSDLFVSDLFPGQALQKGNQITICITTDELAKSQALYDSLQQGGQVLMALSETYFSPAYGMVIDKFGVTFQIFTKKK